MTLPHKIQNESIISLCGEEVRLLKFTRTLISSIDRSCDPYESRYMRKVSERVLPLEVSSSFKMFRNPLECVSCSHGLAKDQVIV